MISPEAQNLLKRELQENILATVEDVTELPARILTPVAIKFTDGRDGRILTLLRCEVKIDA